MRLTAGELRPRRFENLEHGLALPVPAFAVDESVRAGGQVDLGLGTHVEMDGFDGLDPLLARIVAFAEQQVDGLREGGLADLVVAFDDGDPVDRERDLGVIHAAVVAERDAVDPHDTGVLARR